jgi:hypothetical protein
MNCLSIEPEWRDIPGYEGIYQASTTGFIRSESRVLKGRGNNYKTGSRVSLWKDGVRKDFLVARLVALTFLGVPTDGYTVNHIDGNRMNNAVNNLEWLSVADNIRHGFRTGLYSKNQKKVVIRGGDATHSFASMAEASSFLGRNHGYVSGCAKKQKSVKSISGDMYEIIKSDGDCL